MAMRERSRGVYFCGEEKEEEEVEEIGEEMWLNEEIDGVWRRESSVMDARRVNMLRVPSTGRHCQ
jgi:hypothetical protein